MLILSAAEVRQALPMGEAIAAMKPAFAAFSSGLAEMPLRSRLNVRKQGALGLVMPVYMEDPGGEALAVKVVSIFPRNLEKDLPLIHAAVLVLDPDNGRPLALLEGSVLTAIRTGAASGAATDILARPDCRTAAIFGAGVQGRTQLEAICTVRRIETVWVCDPNPQRVDQFIQDMAGKGPIPKDLRAAQSPRQAISNADVICTATTSKVPVFSDTDLKPGVHINGVGSYTPEMQEIPAETVQRARVVVDSREAALSEAGDLIQPLHAGLISTEHIHAELGEVIAGHKEARTGPDQVTFFKSVGIAAQDAAAARLAIAKAQELQLGQVLQWP
jgi:ornithine cyclodeaminase